MQMMLRGEHINCMPDKSQVIIIFSIQKAKSYKFNDLIRKKCLTDMWHITVAWKVVATI